MLISASAPGEPNTETKHGQHTEITYTIRITTQPCNRLHNSNKPTSMSASFPNSWEPYGSSQQSQAIAWRTPATGPAHQTFSQRWKAAHASTIRPIPNTPLKPLLQPSQPKPTPVPSAPSAPSPNPKPQKKALDLASFHNAEHEHRVLARYESVRGEIRDVAAVVKHLSESLDQSTQSNEQTQKLLREEIASIHATFVSIEEKLSKLPHEHVTEQLLKRVVSDLLNPLSESIQSNTKTLNTLDESHTRLSARVGHMADGLFDRIANLVRHQFQNAFSTHFAPLLDRRIRTMFEQHRQTLDTFLERMEDRINLSIVPYLQQHNQFPFRSNDHDRYSLPDDSHIHLERERHRGAPIHPFRLREGCRSRYESRPQTSEHDPRDEKASDFDVTVHDGAGDSVYPPGSGSALRQPAFDRTQGNAPRTGSTSARSGSHRAPRSANPVWARLRIRHKKAPEKGSTKANVEVIDLTNGADSEVREETNLFEDGRMHCKNEGHVLPTNHESSDSHINTPLSKSSLDTDAEACSPAEPELIERENSRIRMTRRPSKSPYFTRSSKKRRLV